MAPAAGSPNVGALDPEPLQHIDRNKFEDEFPVMFKFHSERGRLNEVQMQKVQEIQQRWKAGFVFWLTHDNQEIEIPQWVAVNVVVNNKNNLARSSRICMSLNHTKGYGCNRLVHGQCNYVHECALCGEEDHGVFQKHKNGTFICQRLRKWYDEELRYKAAGFGDPRGHEDRLTEIAKQPRYNSSKARNGQLCTPVTKLASSASGTSNGGPTAALELRLPDVAGKPSAHGSFSDAFDDEARTLAGSQGSTSSSNLSSQRSPALDAKPPPRAGPPTEPPPPLLPVGWQAVWCDENSKYYYWNTKSNTTTWDMPAAQVAETVEVAAIEPRDAQGPCSSPTSGTIKVCIQHWDPPPDDASCMRLLRGERLLVTWSEGGEPGWAYGHVEDDQSKAGYFPNAALTDSYRAPMPRHQGEFCTATEAFDAPGESDGYLSICTGDVLKLLHTTEAPTAWAYVEKLVRHADDSVETKAGWVPEVFLSVSGDCTASTDNGVVRPGAS